MSESVQTQEDVIIQVLQVSQVKGTVFHSLRMRHLLISDIEYYGSGGSRPLAKSWETQLQQAKVFCFDQDRPRREEDEKFE